MAYQCSLSLSVGFLGSPRSFIQYPVQDSATYCVWLGICQTDNGAPLLISLGREDQCIVTDSSDN